MAKPPTTTVTAAPEPPVGQDIEALQLGSSDELPPIETAEEIEAEATEEEMAYAAHLRAGLNDPSPSVRAAFQRMKATGVRGAKKQEPFRGPFKVMHRIKFLTEKGEEITLTHMMPDPKTRAMVPRIVQRGDLPDDVAQFLWADGALQAFQPAQPRPILAKRMESIPLPTIPQSFARDERQ